MQVAAGWKTHFCVCAAPIGLFEVANMSQAWEFGTNLTHEAHQIL